MCLIFERPAPVTANIYVAFSAHRYDGEEDGKTNAQHDPVRDESFERNTHCCVVGMVLVMIGVDTVMALWFSRCRNDLTAQARGDGELSERCRLLCSAGRDVEHSLD